MAVRSMPYLSVDEELEFRRHDDGDVKCRK